MKPTIVLFVSMLSMPAMAQRDFLLTKQRNVWLTSANAAALTTYSDSTIAHATLSYSHADGTRRSLSDGKRQDVYGADVQSFFRLSPSIVAYGRAAYENRSVTEAAGSMFFPTNQLMPFDLVEEDEGNAGDKGMETFNVDGTIGWQVTRHMAIGAQLNYSSGTYAKHRDLRHSNTLMDLSLTYEYNFWPYGTGRDYRGAQKLTPFVFLGLGATYVKTSDKSVFTGNFPLGVGVKYKLGKRVNLGLEWAIHFSLSDELDGVKDPYMIKSSGLFKNTDCYSALQLTLTYSFMQKCRTCNSDKYD